MKLMRAFAVLFLLLFLSACGVATATPTLHPPEVTTLPMPSAEAAMRAYLDAFMVEDYSAMYAMLSPSSQSQLKVDAFTKRYQDDLDAMSVSKMEYSIQSVLTNPDLGPGRLPHHLPYRPVRRHPAGRGRGKSQPGEWRLAPPVAR